MKRCWGLHKWTKWETFQQPMMTLMLTSQGVGPQEYAETRQKRECRHCGKEQQRRVIK